MNHPFSDPDQPVHFLPLTSDAPEAVKGDPAPPMRSRLEVTADVESVLSELDRFDSEGDGDGFEDADEDEQHLRIFSFSFPEEIQNEFHIRRIDLPVRKLLEWVAAEIPGEAKKLNKIRDEFYGGDVSEDYSLAISEWVFASAPPTIEALSIKRVARAAGREQREVRRAAFELEQAEEAIRERNWAVDQLMDRSTPFDKYIEQTRKDQVELGKMWQALHAAWDAFTVERAHRSDAKFLRETRVKLEAMEAQITRESEARAIARDAVYHIRRYETAGAATAIETVHSA